VVLAKRKGEYVVDDAATARLRKQMTPGRNGKRDKREMIDRGPGYQKLLDRKR
jgi:hypothetical protein